MHPFARVVAPNRKRAGPSISHRQGYCIQASTMLFPRRQQGLQGTDTLHTDCPQSPLCERLAWLTSARLIQQYKDTKSRIKSSVVLHECEGHEEHWRHQFFLALTHLENISPEYYSIGKGKGPIADISAIIIHAFASWPEGKTDPLDVYSSNEDAVRSLGVNPWWITLRRHLKLL